ncbi:MAG: glutamate--tRNA ligase [Candidatus Eremiobacteraeota bacterium]|nr:glutamate--tRNA ligase [Candidatus Eremiobacteraeota bacterium]MBC5826490.1 glutamate--tRNA ligase [Candidatus Eremiobacteraeota bacterium]
MTEPTVRVRFAPAPTGMLHVGGARTALFNYLFARRAGGTFLLRSEDTDASRSSLTAESSIAADLHWLGISWDEGPDIGGAWGPYRQSERQEHYGLAAARLMERELAYPCFCSPEELDAERVASEAKGVAPKYSGKCRGLTMAQRRALETQGRRPALRFIMPPRDIYVEDLVRGAVHFPGGLIGDFVVVKSDGVPAYNFAAVVDDSAMEISHVIRGDEHLPNTPRQVALYEALDMPLPLFAHVSMILAPDHHKLSKRHGATAVSEYRDRGFLAEALINYLALLGWSPGNDREFFRLEELVDAFSLERISKGPAIFDHAKLLWFNGQYLRAKPVAERAALFAAWARRDDRLASLAELSDDEWLVTLAAAISDHVGVLADVAKETATVLAEPSQIDGETKAALAHPASRKAVAELGAVARRCGTDRRAFAAATARAALADIGVRTGAKGRALYRPMRLAVTRQEHGIELPVLLPLLGPQRVAARISAALDVSAPGQEAQASG